MSLEIVRRQDNDLRRPRSITSVELGYWQGIRIHHSGGPADQLLRHIQDAAMNQLRDDGSWIYADTHYSHFAQDGKAHEGRGYEVRPAHDGINDHLGLCVPGTWSGDLPSTDTLDVVVAYVHHSNDLLGRRLPTSGHRDVAATSCQGDKFYDWCAKELPDWQGVTGPAPAPPPRRAAPGPAVAFPLPGTWYFGPRSGPWESVSGFLGRWISGRRDHDWLKMWVEQLVRRGWPAGKGRHYLRRWGNDGRYGEEYRELAEAFQRDQRLAADALIGRNTWWAAYNNPVT